MSRLRELDLNEVDDEIRAVCSEVEWDLLRLLEEG